MRDLSKFLALFFTRIFVNLLLLFRSQIWKYPGVIYILLGDYSERLIFPLLIFPNVDKSLEK